MREELRRTERQPDASLPPKWDETMPELQVIEIEYVPPTTTRIINYVPPLPLP